MTNGTNMWLAVGISFLALTSQTVAQEEQWLQYHSAREIVLFSPRLTAGVPRPLAGAKFARGTAAVQGTESVFREMVNFYGQEWLSLGITGPLAQTRIV